MNMEWNMEGIIIYSMDMDYGPNMSVNIAPFGSSPAVF